MVRIRHVGTGIVHNAELDVTFKGNYYNFLCRLSCNLDYCNDYEKVEDDTPVTCKGCLRRMGK